MSARRGAVPIRGAGRPGTLCGVAILLAGCSSTVTGSAALEAGFTPGDPVPGLLNPGNYPTTPHPRFGTAGDGGAILEGQRMAEFVVGPWEVDPTLVRLDQHTTLVWKDAQSLKDNLLDTVRGTTAGAHGFITGFSSQRSSTPPGQLKTLDNVVLRFPTPADATAAAEEMGVPTPPEHGIGDTPEAPVPIPGHPEARGVTHTQPDGSAVVESFTPHGPFVFYDRATAQGGDVGTAAALVAKAVDLQAPRIDGFTPTDPAKLADLPIDPNGLAARTLPLSTADRQTVYSGVWGPYASLHYAIDPVKAAPVNTDAGVLARAYLKSMVWETKDAAGAQKLLQFFLADDPDSSARPANGVPGLPSARCSSSATEDPSQPAFVCYYAVDRYVVNVASRQDVDVQQQAAAQYLILTAK